MASVSFRNIEKAFGKVKIIHGISFDISDGEFVVLVGPSGCGKSTLAAHARRARGNQWR
jgi:multiple sugar transport system ATP-binding protein